jgi:hypothetical protein
MKLRSSCRCLPVIVLATALQGCQGEPAESPGCCYYQCDGGFLGDFSAWYWDAGGCSTSASLICAREHPDARGVTRQEWVEVPDPHAAGADAGLGSECDERAPEWWLLAWEEE